MGEIADMVLEGILCQVCGVLMEDLVVEGQEELSEGPGYPQTCPACQRETEDEEVSQRTR